MAPVTIASLRKDFGTLTAVDDVTFDVDAGQVFGLLGPNGAGKTTLIRCLLGYLQPSDGSALALGGSARAPQIRARIGYLPGDLRLEPRLTGQQIIDLRTRLLQHVGRDVSSNDVDAIATRLSLPLNRRYATLSKGNKQKVGVLLAMLGDPEVLVLDEPTSGLDPLMQDVVLDMVRERRDAGAAVLLSTHILSEAESIADEVGVLSKGRLVTETTVRDLLASARQHLTFTLASEAPSGLLDGIPGLESADIRGVEVEVVVTGSVREVVDRLAAFGVLRIRSEAGELDEIFHAIAEGAA